MSDGKTSTRPIHVNVNDSETPWRVAYVQPLVTAKIDRPKERMVMTFPDLIIREIIAFEVLSIVVVLISLFFNAPLEELANPVKTPNPAKAPWYFLGLQELLHFYPPIVAGVLIPTLVVIALVLVPYVRININRIPLTDVPPMRIRIMTGIVFLLSSLLFLVDRDTVAGIPVLRGVRVAFPEYVAFDLYFPTVLVWLVPFALTFSKGRTRLTAFLRTRGLPFWVVTWFTALATTLTVIGTFFRGAGWELTLPWG